eukprot:scaffold34615_cov180-Amphora_coffeaeformis.AAC.22
MRLQSSLCDPTYTYLASFRDGLGVPSRRLAVIPKPLQSPQSVSSSRQFSHKYSRVYFGEDSIVGTLDF